MKILYVITKSNWGGAQKYVFDLALAMKNFGYDVAVAFGGSGKLAEKLKEKEIRTIEIPNLERDVNFLKELSVLRYLGKVFRDEKPNVVHLNSSKIGVLGAILARMTNIKKIIFTAHGFAFREDRSKVEVTLIKFLSWLTILFSHKTICVSERDLRDVEDWLWIKNRLTVIQNGIEIREISKPERPKEDLIKIVSIGELHKNKGFKYALKTINILKEKVSNFKYTIFSFGGEEENKLRKKIVKLNLQNFVELIITKEKSDDELKNFDIYFLPSIKEGLPYVLLEASLNYLPIVASETGGAGEVVEDNRSGFLVETKDKEGFAVALEKLIRDKELRESFGKEAREIVESKFNIETMIAKTLSFYN